MSKKEPALFRNFHLNKNVEVLPEQNKIVVDGVQKKLEPRLMKVLLLLIEHQDKVVSREKILAEVWKGIIVNDEAVTQSIYQLRRLLKSDFVSDSLIQTVPKKGYRILSEKETSKKLSKRIKLQIPFSGVDFFNRRAAVLAGIAVFLAIVVGSFSLFNVSEPTPLTSTKKIRAALIDDNLIFLDSASTDYEFKDSISIRLSIPSNPDSLEINLKELERIISSVNVDSLASLVGK